MPTAPGSSRPIPSTGWAILRQWPGCEHLFVFHRKKGGAMESVRLSSNPMRSLAGIDEIINRGDREAFVGLLHAIIEQPGGPVADRVRVLYERVQHRAADPEFSAWPQ